MAPIQGIEPRFAVLETDVMPLYQTGILGGEGWIRTSGFRDLQSLALGHSATSPCVVAGDGVEPPTGAYETPEIPFL